MNFWNKKQKLDAEAKERQENSIWENYVTLAALSQLEQPRLDALLSKERQAADKLELSSLRKKFRDDPRSEIIDPLRDLEQVA